LDFHLLSPTPTRSRCPPQESADDATAQHNLRDHPVTRVTAVNSNGGLGDDDGGDYRNESIV
jgi:hypothetical protein